ncbi:MAG: sensor domain-containing diguanylate cyclase [Acidovorax sp.]|nr:sensor domain-containing diguanylate cyclase [Acidovorax sp.]
MTPHEPPESALYRTLLESTRAIPWKIDWATATFAYIGPQIEDLLGWAPTSWRTVQDWADRMHPDDRDRVVNFCISQSQSGVDHEADYRALTTGGDYVWIRDVVHVVRDLQGNVVSLVGFMFDITERKQNEHQLLQLQQELQELSFRDGLTGVNNRRKFDAVYEREWQEAQRTGEPLSLLMFDVDFFKSYNDQYGHVEGDECLRRVARALQQAAHRPRDCLARYGGEEFVLLLPETGAQEAQMLAEELRAKLEARGLTHPASPVGASVTLSIGGASTTPMQAEADPAFFPLADAALYQAKASGRNCVRWAAA